MPKGVYPRTENQLKAAVANLAKGRERPARDRAAVTLREIAADPAWRDRVSAATKEAMADPAIRARHLAALKGQPVNFKGGNGQAPVGMSMTMAALLVPLGYIAELPIKTTWHGTIHRPPNAYKVDFGHPDLRVAVELDGPKHRPRAQQVLDRKKTEVLEALGWTVIRVRHD